LPSKKVRNGRGESKGGVQNLSENCDGKGKGEERSGGLRSSENLDEEGEEREGYC